MRSMTTLVALVILSLAGGGAFLGFHLTRADISWQRVDATLATHFPDLPRIDVPALDAWLADPQRNQPLLLDVRSQEEFAISRIPGSIWIGGGERDAASAALPEEASEHDLVVIGATGLRAAPVTRRLQSEGHSAHLLVHGIFAWAEAGLPVVDDAGNASGVHRWNATMQILLRKELRRRP